MSGSNDTLLVCVVFIDLKNRSSNKLPRSYSMMHRSTGILIEQLDEKTRRVRIAQCFNKNRLLA
jgi:hypothetical protein